MAADGRIPGARSTKGGHYYFPETVKFCAWLERQQAAKASQSKEEKIRRREKIWRQENRLPRVPSPEVAFLKTSDCLRESSRLIQDAYRKQKGASDLSAKDERVKSYRETLLSHLAPLEAIANELRSFDNQTVRK